MAYCEFDHSVDMYLRNKETQQKKYFFLVFNDGLVKPFLKISY